MAQEDYKFWYLVSIASPLLIASPFSTVDLGSGVVDNGSCTVSIVFNTSPIGDGDSDDACHGGDSANEPKPALAPGLPGSRWTPSFNGVLRTELQEPAMVIVALRSEDPFMVIS